MSDKSKVSSGEPDQSAGGGDVETINEQSSKEVAQGGADTVKYETYKKVLSEKKKVLSEYETLQSKLREYEEKELESQGHKDQLIETYKKKAGDFETKYKRAVGTFAHRTMIEAFKTEALKAGCQQEHLDKLVKLTDLPVEAIDDEFNPNFDVLKELVESAKKDNSIFFKNQVGAPRVGTPASGGDFKKDISSMSAHDKAKMVAEQMLKMS